MLDVALRQTGNTRGWWSRKGGCECGRGGHPTKHNYIITPLFMNRLVSKRHWGVSGDEGGYKLKPVRTPMAILGSLGVCIYVPASRHWLISYSPIHLI